jgi:hypothetical protein
MAYDIEERETIIRTDELMGYWIIDTKQRTMITKIKKVKDVVILAEESTENGTIISGQYKVPLKSVRFSNPKSYTEEQRQIMSERAKKTFAK